MTDLVVVVGVVLPAGQLRERFRDQLALAVPGTSHGLVQLEDGIAHVHVRGHTLCLRLSLVIVDRTCEQRDKQIITHLSITTIHCTEHLHQCNPQWMLMNLKMTR